jgi:hypothetical protein
MRLGCRESTVGVRPERLPLPVRSAERAAATNQSQNRLSVEDQKLEEKRGSDADPAPSDIDRQDAKHPHV